MSTNQYRAVINKLKDEELLEEIKRFKKSGRFACLKCIKSYDLPEELLGDIGRKCYWCQALIMRFAKEGDSA